MGLIRKDIALPDAWPPPADAASVAAALSAVRRRDPVGHRIHVILAAAHLVTLPWLTTGSAITYVLLLGYALIRLPNTWRCYPVLLRSAMLWLVVAWVGWFAISIAWSDVPAQGADELRAMRALLLPWMLWPVIETAPLLVIAALAGVVAQHSMQVGQMLGWVGVKIPGRLGGMIHPIQTGAWCVTSMCFAVSAVLGGRGRLRWICLGLAVAAGVGMLATGSRGPWIAATVAVPLTVMGIGLRRPAARRAALALIVFGVVGGAGAWFVAGSKIEPRITVAFEEFEAAIEEQKYGSSTGGRVAMWTWGWTVFRQAPLVGTGAGSYLERATNLEIYREAVAANKRDEKWFDKDHPHSIYLHVLACTGVIGGVLLVAILAAVLVRAWRIAPTDPFCDGTVYAVIGWIIGSQFDAYHLNGHLLGMLGFFLALALPFRPPPRWTARGEDAQPDEVLGSDG